MSRGSAVVCIGEGEPMGWEAGYRTAGRVEAAWRAILLIDRENYYVIREKMGMLSVM